MPRVKTLEKYPMEFRRLFERAAESQVRIALETQAQAEALREELYNYRSMVYHSSDEAFIALTRNIRLVVNGATLIAEIIRGEYGQ